MPITDAQQKKIKNNINKLDYLNGTGILSSSRKHLAKELFLVISSGGVGRKALIELKKLLEQQVEPEEIKDHVMFLSIDSAHSEQEVCETEGLFTSEELMSIPFKGARAVIDPNTINEATEEWVHPELFDKTNAPGFFNGSGASAMRQCGRVLFGQSAAQQELRMKLAKVQDLAGKLTDRGIADPKLKVFFLAGIAGGTGSGTIVDLAFLTRYYLKQLLPTWETKTSLSAYLFLPSACSSFTADTMEAARGNKNAYACLKEINYFMTLKDRKENFVIDYGVLGANSVVIDENIFDFCTLVEGIANGGVIFGDGASTARKIVGLSIMNIICQDNAKTASNSNFFLVDSFFSNQVMKTKPFIEAVSDKQMPREADYIYSVVGYASCVVPVELLTVYAFKKVFDVVYQDFEKYVYADQDAAKKFLKACELDFDSVSKIAQTISKKDLIHKLDHQCEVFFKQYGPFFMINLTNEAVNLIRNTPKDYMDRARRNINGFMANRTRWEAVGQLYDYAAEYLLIQNTQLFEVYTYVIRALRDLLEENAKILTDTKTLATYFGQSFQWSPIDLTKGSHATKAVREYLDDIMNPQETTRLAAQFVNALYDQKEKWIDIAPQEQGGKLSFDAAQAIRDFVMNHMKNIVDTTLESFVVKAYSGDKEAKVFTYDQNNNQIPSGETRVAADEILRKLTVSSTALASTGNGYDLQGAYHNQYLTIPDNCPWLYQAIEEKGVVPKDNIFKSSARDSIVMSVVYSGVPAWSLTWLPKAEETYESADGPKEVGLHIEQSEKGRNWEELPNLYPENLWKDNQVKLRVREKKIIDGVREKMNKARDLGLVKRDDFDDKYYDLLVFDRDKNPQQIAESLELSQNKRYEPKQVYNMLMDSGEAVFVKIEFSRCVMTDDKIRDKDKKEAFTWDLASRIVRKNVRFMKDLDYTLLVAEAVDKYIEQHNKKVVPDDLIVLFGDVLKWDLATFNGKRKKWSIVIDDVEQALGLALSDNLQAMCAHYFGFVEFTKLDPDMLSDLKNVIDDLNNNASDEQLEEADKRAEQLKKAFTALMKARKSNEKPWPDNSPFAKGANESPWPMATLEFAETCKEKSSKDREIDPEAIRRFYKKLTENL